MPASPLSPSDAVSLADLLRAAAAATPEQVIVHVGPDGTEHPMTYRELYAAARRVAAALRRAGTLAGEPLLIALERSDYFLPGFWGALLAGLVAAPLAGEPERILSTWAALNRPALLLDRALAGPLATLAMQRGLPPLANDEPGQPALDGPWATDEVSWSPSTQPAPSALSSDIVGNRPRMRRIEPICRDQEKEAIRTHPPHPYHPCSMVEHQPQLGDLAYLQFSSGSTGEPRGVELTHGALLANIRQIIAACAIHPDDVLVTWMPYYHDMGLIAAHLAPLAAGLKQVKLDPLHFARRPGTWLEAAHRHRATLLTAAPFALALVVQRAMPRQIAELDLRAVRLLAVGAEPLVPSVCRAFLEHLAPAGLRPEALLPVYGLAEASAGVTMSPLGAGLHTHILDRQALTEAGQALAAAPGPHAIEVADVGAALPGCELRVVDERDHPLGEGRVGHIQVRGPQLMRGYQGTGDPRAPFCDGWLRTGDLGFLSGRRLAVIGRAKDVIVVNGRKHHAPDLEELVRGVPGIAAGRVAVCGAYDAAGGVERVLVFVAPRGGWERALPALREVARRVRRVASTSAVEVIPIPARSFPRTTSGKLQRYRLRARYEAGEYAELVQAVRKLLVAPDREAPHANAALPADALERELAEICARSLGADATAIDVHASLFDQGATSLQLHGAAGDRR